MTNGFRPKGLSKTSAVPKAIMACVTLRGWMRLCNGLCMHCGLGSLRLVLLSLSLNFMLRRHQQHCCHIQVHSFLKQRRGRRWRSIIGLDHHASPQMLSCKSCFQRNACSINSVLDPRDVACFALCLGQLSERRQCPYDILRL